MEIVKRCKCCQFAKDTSNKCCYYDSYYTTNGHWFPNSYEDFLGNTQHHLASIPTLSDSEKTSLQKSQIAIIPFGSLRESAKTALATLTRLCTTYVKRFFIIIPIKHKRNTLYVFNQTSYYTHFGCIRSDVNIINDLVHRPGFRVADQGWNFERQMLLLCLNYIAFIGKLYKHFKDFEVVPILVPAIESELISAFAKHFAPLLGDFANLFIFPIPIVKKEEGFQETFGMQFVNALRNKSYPELEKILAMRNKADEPIKTMKILLRMIQLFETEERHQFAKLEADTNKEILDRAKYRYFEFEPIAGPPPRNQEELFFGGVYRRYTEYFQPRNFKSAQEWKDIIAESAETGDKKGDKRSKSPKGSNKSPTPPKSSKSGKKGANAKGKVEPELEVAPPKPKIVDIAVGPD